jgi:hypothetical protein
MHAWLQGQADRVNYLMTKQAKIVAMTCTHAALKRREFLDLGFKFDNLLMEESAQILEIETFIPMLLQVVATWCPISRASLDLPCHSGTIRLCWDCAYSRDAPAQGKRHNHPHVG